MDRELWILTSSNMIIGNLLKNEFKSKSIKCFAVFTAFTQSILLTHFCKWDNKYWFFAVYLGYGISFYIFPKALEKYSLSYAYTIWCGLGLIITTILDLIFYKTKITTKKIIGTLTIISGIKLIK